MLFSLPQPVQDCLARLEGAGFAAHPVGGCVRDLLLGRTPGDWDIATAAHPETVLALFPHTRPTGLQHGTVTVLLGEMALEVTTFRREGDYGDGRRPDGVTFDASLKQDLARRDFTINAMALSPQGRVIDPFGGQRDLAARLVRCVGDPRARFGEDGLRLLRAVRFCAQLDFTLETATAQAIQSQQGRIASVAKERIKTEVEKTLLSPRPAWVGVMADWGLLKVPHRPDLTPLEEVPPEPLPRWRAFCQLTGFSITDLPVERHLRMGILHPERGVIPTLALNAHDLAAFGLTGVALGAAQRRLACHVLAHPEDNTPQGLRKVLNA